MLALRAGFRHWSKAGETELESNFRVNFYTFEQRKNHFR